MNASTNADDFFSESDSFLEKNALLGTSDKTPIANAFFVKFGCLRLWFQRQFRRCFKRRCFSPCSSSLQHQLRWTLKVTTFAFVFISLLNGILRPSYMSPPQHYATLAERVRGSTEPGRANVHNEKIFIAANIIDEDLIRGAWGESLLSLVDILGDENVFVSIYENDSGGGTSAALRELAMRLSCNASVVTGDHLPMTSFPTVRLPNGEERVQRIAYLAEVRNRLLRPLDNTYATDTSSGFRTAADIRFDRILFLNDVYFDPLDAAQLLFSTNIEAGLARYRAACALDFIRGAQQYDTFVVRDTAGYSLGFMVYPWFAPVGSAESRSAVLQQSDAVPVRSCWGGMAAFDSSLFQTRDASSPFSAGASYELLHFRSSGEVFWEAAECCLVFADIEEQYGKTNITEGTGVFINPYVRVAYSKSTWEWLPTFRRFERMFQFVQYLFSKVAYPAHNPRRLHEPGELVVEKVWQPASPGDSEPAGYFTDMLRQAKPGGFCGQRKLFVMKHDLEAANTDTTHTNWRSLPLPA